jgi:hypothetical protein
MGIWMKKIFKTSDIRNDYCPYCRNPELVGVNNPEYMQNRDLALSEKDKEELKIIRCIIEGKITINQAMFYGLLDWW